MIAALAAAAVVITNANVVTVDAGRPHARCVAIEGERIVKVGATDGDCGRSTMDARGATLGTLGMVGFAAVVAFTLPGWPLWAALSAASATWSLIALGGYLVAKKAGAGGDESPGT